MRAPVLSLPMINPGESFLINRVVVHPSHTYSGHNTHTHTHTHTYTKKKPIHTTHAHHDIPGRLATTPSPGPTSKYVLMRVMPPSTSLGGGKR
jgi:hypothetical protein